MPADKPRYLMGVGTPSQHHRGRWPGAWTSSTASCPPATPATASSSPGRAAINIKNEKYKLDDRPIDPECDCPVCRSFSRAYLRHLFKAEEMLAMRLAVMHNLYFYNKLTQRIRDSPGRRGLRRLPPRSPVKSSAGGCWSGSL